MLVFCFSLAAVASPLTPRIVVTRLGGLRCFSGHTLGTPFFAIFWRRSVSTVHLFLRLFCAIFVVFFTASFSHLYEQFFVFVGALFGAFISKFFCIWTYFLCSFCGFFFVIFIWPFSHVRTPAHRPLCTNMAYLPSCV